MKICFGCFEQYDDSFDICPHCGYAEGTEPELATYMRPGAILKERYVIGRALGHGGFSVTYLAWDALLLHKVAIKEYLPSEYATRRPGESRLTVFTGKEGEYFQCHTDITIPYEELDSICAITLGGDEILLIKDGKFVLSVTETLNEPLTEIG